MTLQSLIARWPLGGSSSRLRLQARWREFFAYHGIWALGVRTLRQWSVRTKVLIVLGLMGLPLVPLTFVRVVEQNDTVARAMQRLAGAELAEALVRLDDALLHQLRRLDAGQAVELGDVRARSEALTGRIAAARDSRMDLGTSWEAAEPAIQLAAGDSGLAPASRAEAIKAASLLLMSVHRAAVQAGGLRFTNDAELAHLAELGFDDMPDLLAEIGRLRAAVMLQVPTAGRPASADPAQMLSDLRHRAARIELLLEQAEDEVAGVRGAVQPQAAAAVESTRELLQALNRASPDRLPALALTHEALAAKAWRAVSQLRERAAELAHAKVREARDQARGQRQALFVGLVVSVALSLYLFYAFYLVMRGGLNTLNRQMNRLAQGDLSLRPVPLGSDEVAATMRAMSTSMERLGDLLASVRQGVGSVTQASQQVAAGNAALRERSQLAAQGLQNVVDGVTGYTRQIEASSREVDTVVSTIQALRLESARNRKQIDRLQARLGELQVRSRDIQGAVRLIDSVAFRTNILALNASVEASKAGEAGRGFAVVAQEVRSLAMRSGEAARRIGEIVTGSAEEIEHSGVLADETGRSILESDRHVDRIHAAMTDVATHMRSSEAETVAILEQVRGLREVTEKNLALVEQLAEASVGLRAQGERLTHKVGQFRLG